MLNKQLVIRKFSTSIREATEVVVNKVSTPGPNEVVIKNTFVGVNAIYDRELYRGAVAYIKINFPFVYGVEAVGKVVSTGSKVSLLAEGDTVSTVHVGSAYQEYQIVSENTPKKIPNDTKDYLTISPTGISADLLLKKVAEIKPKEVVVVSAAAGGLGHILVQLCKLKGCHVVAICGNEKKVAMLDELGVCDRIINYNISSVVEVLEKHYKNQIDVAIDSVGVHMFDAFLKNLAPLGRLVVCGLAAELSAPKFDQRMQSRVYEDIYWKGASVRCFMNHLYKSDHDASRTSLTSLYQDNKLVLRQDKTIFSGIEAIQDASEYMLAGKSCGKVVVGL